jgi:hypothetical protein
MDRIPLLNCNVFSSGCQDIGSSSEDIASQVAMAKSAIFGFFCSQGKNLIKILNCNGGKG